MCGIAGFAADAPGAQNRAEILLDALANRGPDGGWWETVDDWCLVQTRLAIVDLSDRVRYPMRAENDRLRLLFNGEIYDHEALRHQLERRGHHFATNCDAEVVVHGYEEWGTGVFERLNGMWAIVLLDRANGELLLARDAMGIKPLLRTTSAPFCFGSDAIALVRAGLVRGDIDLDAISEFAAFHYVPEPFTGIRGVEHVPPGTFLARARDGREHSERWASPVFSAPAAIERVTIEAADATLRDAVERQLKADVDVGVFLSGGVDSALMLQYAVDVGARPAAFTIGFEGFGDYDETPSAREMTARLGVPHHVEMLDAGFLDAITGVRAAYDTPFGDSSAIATLPLARLARRHVTVALSGTGGDDLFAGYYRHRAHLLQRALSLMPPPLLRRIAAADPQRGSEHGKLNRTLRSYAIRLARAGAGGSREYLRLAGSSTSTAVINVFREGLDLAAAGEAVGRRHGLTPENVIDLDTIQNFELATYLAGDLLVKEDRATMAHSVEARVPLLCLEKIERALNDAGKPVRGSRILIMGVSYKAGVGDLRESPALKIIELLRDRGGDISYQDPYVAELPELGLRSGQLPEAAEGIDLAVIVTAHPHIAFQDVLRTVPNVVDLRGVTRADRRANVHQL